MDDLRARMADRVQLTSDGHKAYLEAVEGAFGGDIDYAMIVKLYGSDGGVSSEKRYSPAECTGARKVKSSGKPDAQHISTSYVERNNLTMRMSIRRFTRLTNAFSKKIETHAHSVSLHFMYYNFCRQHKGLDGISPAMAAGVTDHLWEIEDIVRLVNEARPKPGPREKYQKQNSNCPTTIKRLPVPCVLAAFSIIGLIEWRIADTTRHPRTLPSPCSVFCTLGRSIVDGEILHFVQNDR